MSIPYVPKKTKSRFYIPPTLEDDFASFLEHDIPNVVMDFTVIPDWYAQFEEQQYSPSVIRGQIYPDATKSRYSDTDNNLNFRAALKAGIKKGDMLKDPNGTYYLLDWQIAPQPNNMETRAVRCNARISFQRYFNDEVDDMGYLISEEGWKTIVDDIPCNAYRYDGRPEYTAVIGNPGVSPNALTLLSVQYNNKTKELAIEDTFKWGNETYLIVDINRVGLNIEGTSGVLMIQAKKKAGGIDG